MQIIKRPGPGLLAFLLGVAIGVMLTLSAAEMYIRNAYEHGFWSISAAVLGGVALYYFLQPFLPDFGDHSHNKKALEVGMGTDICQRIRLAGTSYCSGYVESFIVTVSRAMSRMLQEATALRLSEGESHPLKSTGSPNAAQEPSFQSAMHVSHEPFCCCSQACAAAAFASLDMVTGRCACSTSEETTASRRFSERGAAAQHLCGEEHASEEAAFQPRLRQPACDAAVASRQRTAAGRVPRAAHPAHPVSRLRPKLHEVPLFCASDKAPLCEKLLRPQPLSMRLCVRCMAAGMDMFGRKAHWQCRG